MFGGMRTYDEIYSTFRWQKPERFNIAAAVCDRHAAATPNAPALIHEAADGKIAVFSFAELQRGANRAANMFAAHGVGRGDRVMAVLSQSPEMAFTLLGCWKLGGIVVPVSTLFASEAIRERAASVEATAIVTDRENLPKVADLTKVIPTLKAIFVTDRGGGGARSFHSDLERASDRFVTLDTLADEPAFICFTSGSTGAPKGALHAHRILLGHVPGFHLLHRFFGQEGDLSWSPADWSWLAGLMGVLTPTWWFGKPVLACRPRARFDPEHALHLMARHEVRNTLLIPTMLRLIRQVPSRPKVHLRSMFSGGEVAGEDLFDWCKQEFGFLPNEGYGQTECNMVMAHLPELMPARFGALGKPLPGMAAAVLSPDDIPVAPGEVGELVFRSPNPVMLLRYWNNPEATAEKIRDGWLHTGDLVRIDDEGYYWFVGRNDDVIKSSGYRIGPGEIENCLAAHPAVRAAIAIGVPDELRGGAVKAFVVLRDETEASPALEAELRDFVKGRLAKHEVPRDFEFIDRLPTTSTGKVQRRVLQEMERERRANLAPIDGAAAGPNTL